MAGYLALCVVILLSLSTEVISQGTDACSTTFCEAPLKCIVSNTTGSALCVPDCGIHNGGCPADQTCEIVTYDCDSANRFPCDPGSYVKCKNPLYVTCGSDAFLACDSEFTYCLQQNKTRRASCIASCLSDNGGCSEDKTCITTVSSSNEGDHDDEGDDDDDDEGEDREERDDDGGIREISITCSNPDDLPSDCPAGQQVNPCGNLCQETCDDIIAGESRSCIEVCAPAACVCPQGLVLFRDRCVDPRLCYVLDKYPPAIDPLPLLDNQLLYSFISGSSTHDFVKDRFLTAVHNVLSEGGFHGVKVDLHGIYQDKDLQIVVQLSGDSVSGDSPSQFSDILKDNSHKLPLNITDVTPITPNDGKRKCNSLVVNTVLISFGTACAVITLSFLLLLMMYCVRMSKTTARPHREKLKMETKDNGDIYEVNDAFNEKDKLEFAI